MIELRIGIMCDLKNVLPDDVPGRQMQFAIERPVASHRQLLKMATREQAQKDAST
jgi:hypothetical protein